MILSLTYYQSPIAQMTIISDKDGIYLLEFEGRKNLEKDISSLLRNKNATLVEKETIFSAQLKEELHQYFAGKLQTFKTPLHILGSPFQKEVWETLLKIPFGETKSYQDQAKLFGNEKAVRAIASANGKNRLAIIIPCHRVINKNGELGGYGGGIDRKRWLLHHEKLFLNYKSV
ncbi:methylated-DNA--[protein]-cysteine S-methyltransferase [bacterium]|nr:methylated-DNA--[protein]-cysteine S-methyltransferase [bacterium]